MAEYALILIGLLVTVPLARRAFLPARYLPGNPSFPWGLQ